VIGLPASVASVFFPGLVNCPPIASVLYFCSLTGAFFEDVTGDVHQTPAALANQIAYTELYCGPLLYQAFGLAALMILSILMFQRGAQGAVRGEPQSDLRLWAAAVSPVVLGMGFWSIGWFLLGSYLLLSGALFLLHWVTRPRWQQSVSY
jgi:hypothetical protein